MSRPLHDFVFVTESTGKPTTIRMDGQELHGVTAAHIDWSVNEMPHVTLTFAATRIAVEAMDMAVAVKTEKDSQINGQMSVEDVL